MSEATDSGPKNPRNAKIKWIKGIDGKDHAIYDDGHDDHHKKSIWANEWLWFAVILAAIWAYFDQDSFYGFLTRLSNRFIEPLMGLAIFFVVAFFLFGKGIEAGKKAMGLGGGHDDHGKKKGGH